MDGQGGAPEETAVPEEFAMGRRGGRTPVPNTGIRYDTPPAATNNPALLPPLHPSPSSMNTKPQCSLACDRCICNWAGPAPRTGSVRWLTPPPANLVHSFVRL